MKIQNISTGVLPNSHDSSSKNNVAFKSRLTFDVGASDPRGSLKILAQDNDGKDLFVYKGFVNDSTKGFTDNENFIQRIANATNVEELIDNDIASIKTQAKDSTLSEIALEGLNSKLEALQKDKAILQNLPESEKELTGFSLLLPGTLREKTALFMANLKKTDGSSLEGVRLEKIIDEIKKQDKVKLSKDFNPATNFIPCKDLAGTGVGIAKKILNHPEYSKRFDKGFFGVAVQTGGGFGAVDIKLKDDNFIEIETDEGGHDLVFDSETRTQKRLGKLGASTKAIISNYAKSIGIKDENDIETLVKTGKAEMATQQYIKLNTESNKKAVKLLTDSGVYEIVNANAEATTLKAKNVKAFEKGSTSAIHKYADAIANHAITKINRGANLYVLSGPLAMGLNDKIMEKPELFGEGIKDMRDLIFSKINNLVGDDFTCNKLRANNDFDIVCDKSMSIADNTPGGSLLLAGKTNKFARRGEWITVNAEALKEPLSKAPADKQVLTTEAKGFLTKIPKKVKVIGGIVAGLFAAYEISQKSLHDKKQLSE